MNQVQPKGSETRWEIIKEDLICVLFLYTVLQILTHVMIFGFQFVNAHC